MLTPGLFDIRFREQFDLLSPLKLSGRPSERQADYPSQPPPPPSAREESTGVGSGDRPAVKDDH